MTFLNHAGDNGFRHDKRSIQVNVDNLTEFCRTHVAHRNTFDNTCIVYKDIDNTYLFFYLCNQSVHLFFAGNVTNITESLDTFFLISSQAFVYQFLLDIVENNSGTCCSKSRCNSKTNSVRSACYKSYLTFQ